MRKRQRDWFSLKDDPLTPYMVGRLIGANEMAIAVLSGPDGEKMATTVAATLERVLPYFMVEIDDKAKP